MAVGVLSKLTGKLSINNVLFSTLGNTIVAKLGKLVVEVTNGSPLNGWLVSFIC